jgi:hypothetical protein
MLGNYSRTDNNKRFAQMSTCDLHTEEEEEHPYGESPDKQVFTQSGGKSLVPLEPRSNINHLKSLE